MPKHPESRRLPTMAAFGFMSGLPLPLTLFTLQYWFTTYGISLHAIAFTAWVGLPYTCKFLWSALFDRPAPRATRRLGRRRGWLVMVQPALVVAAAGLALTDPGRDTTLTLVMAALVAFCSASQDILIDAWRIETFSEATQGAALAAYVWGYRGAMVVSDSGAIWLSRRIGWHGALLVMAALLACGLLVTLLAPEPAARPAALRAIGIRARIEAAFIAPFREFLARSRAAWVLAFVLLFKLGKVYADQTAAGLYRYRLGLPSDAVAAANAFSYAGTLAGAATGALLVAKLGAKRAVLVAGLAQAASLGLYLVLLAVGPSPAMLIAKVVVEFFAGAMADAAFLTYLSLLCAREFSASQYAMLSSLAAVSLHGAGGFAGYAVEALGYPAFYAATILACLPSLLIALMLRDVAKKPQQANLA